MFNTALHLTLRLQPVIVLYTLVSICSKLASRQLPPTDSLQIGSYFWSCASNWRLVGLLVTMVLLLGTYAFFWQRVIKNVKMSVVYANKGASVFWGQLAAVILFSEHLAWGHILGIIMIFGGILLANSEQ